MDSRVFLDSHNYLHTTHLGGSVGIRKFFSAENSPPSLDKAFFRVYAERRSRPEASRPLAMSTFVALYFSGAAFASACAIA